MRFSTKNIVYDWTHELPKDLRFRILGNLEIMWKTQKQVEAEPCTQSLFHKKNWY